MPDALARARAAPRVPALNLALFLATVATTLLAGGFPPALDRAPAAGSWVSRLAADLAATAAQRLPFAAALLAILLCHEMGHYLLARVHRVDSTLPFFIPVPFGVGTFGAVIRIRSALPSRRATLDIGAAGPLAGAAVALPLLAWGLRHSEIHPAAAVAAAPAGLIPMLLAHLHGVAAPAGDASLLGDSLLTRALERVVLGPLPPGQDVLLHPVAIAAWIGLLVTTLNLIPLGQLDGGHVTYALLGRRGARALSRATSWALLAAGLFLCWSWLVWWALTRFWVRLDHPPALDEGPLDRPRRGLAIASLLLFVLTFVPVPIS